MQSSCMALADSILSLRSDRCNCVEIVDQVVGYTYGGDVLVWKRRVNRGGEIYQVVWRKNALAIIV